MRLFLTHKYVGLWNFFEPAFCIRPPTATLLNDVKLYRSGEIINLNIKLQPQHTSEAYNNLYWIQLFTLCLKKCH